MHPLTDTHRPAQGRWFDLIGSQRHLLQNVHHAGLDPLVAPAPYRGGRTLLIGYAPLGAAEDQDLNELLKDHPVGDARPVAAEGMVQFPVGQQAGELLPEGLLLMYGGTAGMESLLQFGKLR